MKDLNQAIAGRRAVREFTAEAVDEQTINRVIGAATRAPSAMNAQSWTSTVVRNQDLYTRTSDAAKAHMLATIPADEPPHLSPHINDPHYQIFYHAPALMLISASTEGLWNIENCVLAAQNLMLATVMAGLGSCWIGFAQSYLRTPEGKVALGLPSAWAPVAPIILGHPKAMPPAVPRKPPEILWIKLRFKENVLC